MRNKKNITILFIIIFLQGFVFYGPVATIFRQNRGLSLSDIFLIEAFSGFLMIILEVPWGYIADKFGYKRVFISSQFIYFISKIVFFKSYSFISFTFERVLISLALTGLSGCDVAILFKSDIKENNEKNMSRYNGLSTLGFLMSGIISSIIVSYSIDATVCLTIFPYGIAFILSLFLDDVALNKRKEYNLKTCFKMFLNHKDMLYLALFLGLIDVITQSTTVFLDKVKYMEVGIPISLFGVISVIITICSLLVFKTHSLTNRFGKENMVMFSTVIISISSLLLFSTNSILISIFSVLIINLSFSFIVTISFEYKNKRAEDHNRATIISIYSMIINCAYIFISPIIGEISNFALKYAFLFCSLLTLLALLLFKKFIKFYN